jgi:hypothetical protein
MKNLSPSKPSSKEARVPTVPIPLLEAFDAAYVQRRKQITEKILKLKNGRQLAYFTERGYGYRK